MNKGKKGDNMIYLVVNDLQPAQWKGTRSHSAPSFSASLAPGGDRGGGGQAVDNGGDLDQGGDDDDGDDVVTTR